MRSARLRSLAVMLLAAAALAACDAAQDGDPGGEDEAMVESDAAADSDAAAVTVGAELVDQPDAEVEMRMFDFRPGEVEIAAGETVEFVNTDETLHTVTSDDDLFDEELDGSDASVQVTFEEPGTYSFACRPHPFMTGTITVTS